jgi:hypothetical protein
MPLDTRRLALERFLRRRERQRAAWIARAKETAESEPQPPTSYITVPTLARF